MRGNPHVRFCRRAGTGNRARLASGIRFNSNFQWSTTSRDVKDGNAAHITREPEQVKAFRDTWRDGIHSYLTYLRDRLTVARDLLRQREGVKSPKEEGGEERRE